MLVPGLVAVVLVALAAAGWWWHSRRRTAALPASLTEVSREDARREVAPPPDLDADPWT